MEKIDGGTVVIVYNKDTGKIIPYDWSSKGEILLPYPHVLYQNDLLVGTFPSTEIDWENGYLIKEGI
jgi:hypothetical protein